MSLTLKSGVTMMLAIAQVIAMEISQNNKCRTPYFASKIEPVDADENPLRPFAHGAFEALVAKEGPCDGAGILRRRQTREKWV